MRLTEIRIAGFGGQGVILSAIVVGKAASIFQGGHATMTQNFGPESRGGACSAQVILSDSPILYPYVTRPDVLVAMSQEAYTRFVAGAEGRRPAAGRTGPGSAWRSLPDGIRVYGVPATRLAEELGRRMVLNVVMVGFFAAVTGLLDEQACGAVEDSVPPPSGS